MTKISTKAIFLIKLKKKYEKIAKKEKILKGAELNKLVFLELKTKSKIFTI